MKHCLFTLVAVILVGTFLFPATTDGGGMKAGLCHAKGHGSYHEITVSVNAVPAHLKHGDGFPGRPVPESDGYRFSDDCMPEADLCFATVIRAETPTDEPNYLVVILNDPWMDDWRADVESWDGGVLQAAIPGALLPNEFVVGLWSGEDGIELFFDGSMRIDCGTLINLP